MLLAERRPVSLILFRTPQTPLNLAEIRIRGQHKSQCAPISGLDFVACIQSSSGHFHTLRKLFRYLQYGRRGLALVCSLDKRGLALSPQDLCKLPRRLFNPQLLRIGVYLTGISSGILGGTFPLSQALSDPH